MDINSSAGYYDIDDILAEEQTLPSIFQVDAVALGYLDESDDHPDLKRGTKLELPLWLGSALAGRNYVEIKLPRFFSKNFRINLLAKPSAVNLSETSTYFYEFGMKLQRMVDNKQISQTLQKSLQERIRVIIDKAQNFRNLDINAFSSCLASLEMKVFTSKYKSALNYYKWKNRRRAKLTRSSMLINPRKGGYNSSPRTFT